jgi:hypothetical protein
MWNEKISNGSENVEFWNLMTVMKLLMQDRMCFVCRGFTGQNEIERF